MKLFYFFALHGSWITSLSYLYVGDALSNDGYFHFFSVLNPYGHLSIIRALSSLTFISVGVLCVCFVFFICLVYFYSHSAGGYDRRRLENSTFLILSF